MPKSNNKPSKRDKALQRFAAITPREAGGALKLKDARQYLGGISDPTMRRLIREGQLRPCRNLRHYLLPISELNRWLQEGQTTD